MNVPEQHKRRAIKFAYSDEPTISDLMTAIQSDMSMSALDRIAASNALRIKAQGMSGNTMLSSLMARGAGAILGALISRYFGGGILGGVAGSLIGGAVGGHMYERSRPKPLFPGYKFIG